MDLPKNTKGKSQILLPSSAQFQLSEVEAEMVFIVAISTHPPTHPTTHPTNQPPTQPPVHRESTI